MNIYKVIKARDQMVCVLKTSNIILHKYTSLIDTDFQKGVSRSQLWGMGIGTDAKRWHKLNHFILLCCLNFITSKNDLFSFFYYDKIYITKNLPFYPFLSVQFGGIQYAHVVCNHPHHTSAQLLSSSLTEALYPLKYNTASNLPPVTFNLRN